MVISDRTLDQSSSSGEVVSTVQFGPVSRSDNDDSDDEFTIIVSNTNLAYVACKESLMDRGANGGVIGIDACVLNWYPKFVNIWGIGEHQLKKLRMCDAAAKVLSHRGPIIVECRAPDGGETLGLAAAT